VKVNHLADGGLADESIILPVALVLPGLRIFDAHEGFLVTPIHGGVRGLGGYEAEEDKSANELEHVWSSYKDCGAQLSQ
jgi:hypothetical protein